MTSAGYTFNPPPGWPVPEADWQPPNGWVPDPSWPAAPDGWQFWVKLSTPSIESSGASEAHRNGEDLQGMAPVDEGPAVRSGESGDADELLRLRQRVLELEADLQRAKASAAGVDQLVELSDERVLQEVGIYRYHHPLENAAAYKSALAALMDDIKEMVRAKSAVLASDLFTYNNSLAQGRRMTAEFSKLMLRAYNAEADNCVRSLRAGNVQTALRRLEASAAAVAKLGAMMDMRINPLFHDLRVRELELTADYLMKVQVEKEAAREERARLREERRAEQELAAERARLEKERDHYLNALALARATGDSIDDAELRARLDDIEQAIQANDYRAANIRAGYVYVISNRGAFGGDVVKIGLTRRLEPMDRVRELGDASVPFPFDVHALFFSEDAVSVEAELHRAFAERRLNHVNARREFFFATPTEVRRVLLEKVGNLLEFVEQPEASQFLQSTKYWPEGQRAGAMVAPAE